ncbi:SRPBCC family protein [Alkalibacillus salilacus]|uniref:Polyketide cyclase / dehydrase and lipid transport n=1 Tax=Alkalibacillus salilacus TaxID=284582 RepID=A0ABT9VB01_9BACI|nr:SRPBCC family protein [Alkalibacillus salilacus]MDQ0158143.1 hypothetical protein [Alkalibacillus salilacus]
MSFSREIVIQAPVDDVYQVVTKYEYISEASHIVDVSIDHVDDLAAGDQLIETRQVRGRKVDSTWTIDEMKENQLFVVSSDQNQLHLTYIYTFSEVEEGTHIRLDVMMKTKGLRNKLMKPFIKKIIEGEDGEQLQYIKNYIEKSS